MSSICKTCSQEISWDARKREALHIRGPVNLDGTMHHCMKTTGASAVTKTTNEDALTRIATAVEELVTMLKLQGWNAGIENR